jgi:tellurite resistance protein TehA-like permease
VLHGVLKSIIITITIIIIMIIVIPFFILVCCIIIRIVNYRHNTRESKKLISIN